MINKSIKKTLKFIFYPVVLALINLLLLSLVMKYYIGNLDINSVLIDKKPDFEYKVNDIFTEESEQENGAIKQSDVKFPKINEKYGKIEIKSINMSAELIFGDGEKALKSGVGQYSGSSIPGYGGMILLTGHNYMFPQVENAKIDDIIKITTSYGIYKYKISNVKILEKDAYDSFKIDNSKEQLVFYTCYPFTSLGSINTRYFVYADYVSGPKIIK